MICLRDLDSDAGHAAAKVGAFPFLVGRSADADLRSTRHGVWERHFQIDHLNEEFILTPCGDGKLAVDGVSVNESFRLRNGSVICAGALRLQFNLSDAVVRPYRYRELLTWLILAGLTAFQVFLLVVLPR